MYSPQIANLVAQITSDSRFLSVAKGNPYVFSNAENATNITLTVGGQVNDSPASNLTVTGGSTTHEPDQVEMFFNYFGPNPHCGELAGVSNFPVSVIYVQVPIINSRFDLAGATFNLENH